MPAESELIRRYFVDGPRRADVVQGIGDDGAVTRPRAGDELVISVDTLIEGVHFPHDTQPAAVGHKALAVNLSDLAAMGAEPAWATLALTLPRVDEHWLTEFSGGLMRFARTHGVQLIGGDLTRGALSITIQVIGFVPPGMALYRNGARPGDLIFVTGSIGDAGLGLAALRGKLELSSESTDCAIARLNQPSPRIDAGVALRGCASAAIDVSDGLAVDLERLLAASQTGAVIELMRVPLSTAARNAFAEQVDWPLVLTAGDDYELLFTAPPERAHTVRERFRALACGVAEIGYIESGHGVRYTLGGGTYALYGSSGYDHFAQS